MKKMLLGFFLFLFVTNGVNAQKKTIELSSVKIGSITGNYSKIINLENNDTYYFLYLGFQNAKYEHITDIKSVFFTRQDDLNDFIKDLKAALPEMGTKTSINWERNLYSLTLYDFSKDLYLAEKPSKGDGYTIINKKGVDKLVEWLDTIHMGKE